MEHFRGLCCIKNRSWGSSIGTRVSRSLFAHPGPSGANRAWPRGRPTNMCGSLILRAFTDFHNRLRPLM